MSSDTSATIQQIIDRAASDPDFLKRLAQDPVGTMQVEEYDITPDELKAFLGMEGATDEETAEMLQARLSHSSGDSDPLALGPGA